MSIEPERSLESVFRPVNTGRMSEVIVAQIKEAIRDGVFSPGDRLPPERDLAERFSVSRMTIRDALRILETGGLVSIRVGARGGAFIRQPGSTVVSQNVADMLATAALSAEEITEARRIIELGAVDLACQHASEDDLVALEDICTRAEAAFARSGFSPEYSSEFHARLGRASHNGAIALIAQGLHDPLVRSVARARHRKQAPAGQPEPDPYADAQLRDHKKLTAALRARDVARARRIMTAHLRRTAEELGILEKER